MMDSAVIIILLRRCDLRILDLPGLMLLNIRSAWFNALNGKSTI